VSEGIEKSGGRGEKFFDNSATDLETIRMGGEKKRHSKRGIVSYRLREHQKIPVERRKRRNNRY